MTWMGNANVKTDTWSKLPRIIENDHMLKPRYICLFAEENHIANSCASLPQTVAPEEYIYETVHNRVVKFFQGSHNMS